MTSSSSLFHRGAYALTTAAVIGASAMLASFSAQAQEAKVSPVSSQTNPVTVNTDCRNWKPGELMASTECEILKGRALDAQGRGLDTQNRALDAQAKIIAEQKGCLLKLVDFKKDHPDKFAALGPISRENACTVLGRIPKPTASSGPRIGG